MPKKSQVGVSDPVNGPTEEPLVIEDCAMPDRYSWNVKLDEDGSPKLEVPVYKSQDEELGVKEDLTNAAPKMFEYSTELDELESGRCSGLKKAQVYAYDMTGFILTPENHLMHTPEQIAAWEYAMNDYFSEHPTETT